MKKLVITGVWLVVIALLFWRVKRHIGDAAKGPPSDAVVARELPGTWVMRPDGRKKSTCVYGADGHFVARLPNAKLEGTWWVTNGYLMETFTETFTNGVKRGSYTGGSQIVRMDSQELVERDPGYSYPDSVFQKVQ